jgi:hypothetical protein
MGHVGGRFAGRDVTTSQRDRGIAPADDQKRPADEPEPTQKTPTGAEIPIPSRDAFLGDLRRAAKTRSDHAAELAGEARSERAGAEQLADVAREMRLRNS